MHTCSECYRNFHSTAALNAHCRDRADHAYCEDCQRVFVHFNALQQHLDNSPVHQDSDADHSYNSSSGYDYESSDSGEEDETTFCKSCHRSFVNKLSLYRHLAQSSKHNWCFVCSRDFATESALDQHNSSRVHNSRDLNCPLCSKSFKVPSAIALHIESGACHNINRHQVTTAVHALRIIPTVSLSHRLTGPSGRGTITNYSANEQAFNGTAYECYLCHRTFRSLGSLNSHLNSPAHDEDEFKCPKCSRTYKLISGLIQHIESEVCGLARFQQVKDQMSDLTEQFSRLLKF